MVYKSNREWDLTEIKQNFENAMKIFISCTTSLTARTEIKCAPTKPYTISKYHSASKQN